jgi:anti-anti-sigma factor
MKQSANERENLQHRRIDSEDYMLNVMIKKVGDALIFRCWGRLVAGQEAWTLYNTAISQQFQRTVVLDLRGVDQVDARGLAVLVSLKQWAYGAGGRLELIPSKPVQEMLDLTGLHFMFEIHPPENMPVGTDLFSGSESTFKSDQA